MTLNGPSFNSSFVKNCSLTLSLTHFAIADLPVPRGTLTVVTALSVLTGLRTGAIHLTLIDVCKRPRETRSSSTRFINVSNKFYVVFVHV